MSKLKTALLTFALVLPLHAQANFIKYKNYYIPIGGSCGNAEIPANAPAAIDLGKARVFVTTDIDSGSGDPDDTQSLAHLLAFANEVEIEGFSTSHPNSANSINLGKVVIDDAIDDYESDLPDLKSASDVLNPVNPADFPDPKFLRDNVYIGSTLIGDSAGGSPGDITGGGWFEANGSISEGAEAIITSIRCAYKDGDTRPLHVLTWGTSSEVVRALEKAPDIIKYIRVVSYSGHNNENLGGSRDFSPVNRYLKRLAKNEDLWWIDFAAGNSKKPLTTCDVSSLDDELAVIKSGGKLGTDTIRYNNPNGSPGFDGCNERFFKLGDTITTMFVLFNNANGRSYPNTASWGNYSNDSSVGQNYWELPDSTYHRRTDVYATWKERVKNL